MATRPRPEPGAADVTEVTDQATPDTGAPVEDDASRARDAQQALPGVELPGLTLADRAAREIPDADLQAALHQLAHRVQSMPAIDRAAILRESARRIGLR